MTRITNRLALCALLFLCILSCTACGKKSKDTYHGDYIYCLDSTDTKLQFEPYTPKASGGSALIKEYLSQLKKDPNDISLKKAFPEDVTLEEYSLDDAGQLILYFDSAYTNHTGVSEILRRAAIVKTLCQVKEVNSIQFYVAGQPLTDSNMDAIGYMTEDTFIDNTGGITNYKQNATLNMYYADSDGNSLVKVPVDITYDATIPLEQLAMEQLMKGPYTIDGVKKEEVLPTIPDGTELNKITVKDYTCYIDLSSKFLKTRKDITADVAVYSVVDTLAELSNINKVQFSIDGEQVLLYNDTIDLGSPLERNLDLVK